MIIKNVGNAEYYNENGFDMILLDCIRENNILDDMLLRNRYNKAIKESGILSENSIMILNEFSIKNIKDTVLRVLNSLLDKIVSVFNYVIPYVLSAYLK